MNALAKKLLGIGLGAFFIVGSSVYGQNILYSNTNIDSGHSLTLPNGQWIGNEIILGNPTASYATITNFSFEIFSPNATALSDFQADVQLLANDGRPVNGSASPNTIIYDSGLFDLSSASFEEYGNAITLDFDLTLALALAGNDFTLSVMVTNITAGTVGVELFGPAPTVGNNYGDYWWNQENGNGWNLYTNSVPIAFGAQFQGIPSPEPSSISLAAAGLSLLAGVTRFRRRQIEPSSKR